MSAQGYDLELVPFDRNSRYPNEWMLSFWATLTGLSRAEIWDALPPRLQKATGWRGQDMRELAEKLRLNAAPRFIPFDEHTPWPAVLRYRKTKLTLARETVALRQEKGDPKAKAPDYWYCAVYNRGLVIDPAETPAILSLDDWKFNYVEYHITSMLPIWWGDKLQLTKNDF